MPPSIGPWMSTFAAFRIFTDDIFAGVPKLAETILVVETNFIFHLISYSKLFFSFEII